MASVCLQEWSSPQRPWTTRAGTQLSSQQNSISWYSSWTPCISLYAHYLWSWTQKNLSLFPLPFRYLCPLIRSLWAVSTWGLTVPVLPAFSSYDRGCSPFFHVISRLAEGALCSLIQTTGLFSVQDGSELLYNKRERNLYSSSCGVLWVI